MKKALGFILTLMFWFPAGGAFSGDRRFRGGEDAGQLSIPLSRAGAGGAALPGEQAGQAGLRLGLERGAPAVTSVPPDVQKLMDLTNNPGLRTAIAKFYGLLEKSNAGTRFRDFLRGLDPVGMKNLVDVMDSLWGDVMSAPRNDAQEAALGRLVEPFAGIVAALDGRGLEQFGRTLSNLNQNGISGLTGLLQSGGARAPSAGNPVTQFFNGLYGMGGNTLAQMINGGLGGQIGNFLSSARSLSLGENRDSHGLASPASAVGHLATFISAAASSGDAGSASNARQFLLSLFNSRRTPSGDIMRGPGPDTMSSAARFFAQLGSQASMALGQIVSMPQTGLNGIMALAELATRMSPTVDFVGRAREAYYESHGRDNRLLQPFNNFTAFLNTVAARPETLQAFASWLGSSQPALPGSPNGGLVQLWSLIGRGNVREALDLVLGSGWDFN